MLRNNSSPKKDTKDVTSSFHQLFQLHLNPHHLILSQLMICQQQRQQQLQQQKLCAINGNFDVLILENVLNHTKGAMESAIAMTHLTNTIAQFSQPLQHSHEQQPQQPCQQQQQ